MFRQLVEVADRFAAENSAQVAQEHQEGSASPQQIAEGAGTQVPADDRSIQNKFGNGFVDRLECQGNLAG